MKPVDKLFLRVVGWAALTALSAFLTYILGNLWVGYVFVAVFLVSAVFLYDATLTFKFVWDNSKEQDESSTD